MERSLLPNEAHMQGSSNSEDHEDGFEKRLSNMYDTFQSKVDTLMRYTDEVLQVCSVSLAASNIRHTPITKRIKSWESAKDSIRRQHQELVLWRRLRCAVEAKGRQWDEYCRELGLQTSQNETRALQTPADMFAALQDFGGLRISLYFPGDVKRVASILESRVEIIKTTNKRQGSGERPKRLQELIDYLQSPEPVSNHAHRPAQVNDPLRRGFARTFSGYKATHFIVKLREEDIPDDRRYAWKDIVVEIQVGTLVMHVWSEIEHDMIYKPVESQGEGISDDEERLLDLINGIVLTGEAALQQLEASTAKRLNRRAANKDAMASSYFELATWIEKDCQLLGMPIGGGEWRLLDRVYSILKAMDKHKHSQVTDLLKAAVTSHGQTRQTLPMAMLGALCRQTPISQLQWPSFDGFTVMALAQNARLWATRLVHSLNLAIYLGVGDAFISIDVQQPRPSLVSFLDILHPDRPSYTSAESAEAIASFCRAILDPMNQPVSTIEQIVNALQAAKMLPRTDTVVSIATVTGSRTIMIPDVISQMLSINDTLGHRLEDRVDASELYGILDFINFYLSHDGDQVNDHIHLWDRLMGPSINRRYISHVHNRFFIPQPPRQGSRVGLWQLADCSIQLEVVKLCSDDMNQPSRELQRDGDDDMSSPFDGILQLAFRLFPEDQQVRVHKAWTMARVLRPGRKPTHRHASLPNSHSSFRTKKPISQALVGHSMGYEFASANVAQVGETSINFMPIRPGESVSVDHPHTAHLRATGPVGMIFAPPNSPEVDEMRNDPASIHVSASTFFSAEYMDHNACPSFSVHPDLPSSTYRDADSPSICLSAPMFLPATLDDFQRHLGLDVATWPDYVLDEREVPLLTSSAPPGPAKLEESNRKRKRATGFSSSRLQ